jgi:hypothetical protein
MSVNCEHCGEIETKSKQYEFEGVEWCAACAYANGYISSREAKREFSKDVRLPTN